MAGFRALLGEHVKAADADWQHWLPRLKKDPQVGMGILMCSRAPPKAQVAATTTRLQSSSLELTWRLGIAAGSLQQD